MGVLLCMVCRVNIIPADALVANANRASAGMMLTQELTLYKFIILLLYYNGCYLTRSRREQKKIVEWLTYLFYIGIFEVLKLKLFTGNCM